MTAAPRLVAGTGATSSAGVLPGALRRLRAPALGAVAAQFSQALASLVVSVLGLRLLTAAEFAVLALLLGLVVLATGAMTGLVGDSLTVLDRSDRRVRAGLQVCCGALAAALFALGTAGTLATGLLGARDALLFGLLLAAFTVEDVLRRLLVAELRTWSVVAVDLGHLAVALAALAATGAAYGRLTTTDFLLALAVGQILAVPLAVVLLPRGQRWLAPREAADVRAVVRYGGWRAAQQAVRPATLTVVRALLLVGAGATALAQVEAARVLLSPVLLAVQGLGGFLLARAAQQRGRALRGVVQRADRVALGLAVVSLLLAVLLTALLPALAPLLVGDQVTLPPGAVVGWSLTGAASGAAVAYAGLAAVRSSPRAVLLRRLVDAAVSVVVVLALVSGEERAELAPLGLAVGSAVSALLARRLVLRSGTARGPGKG